MSEEEASAAAAAAAAQGQDDEDDVVPGYKAPEKKDLKTIINTDAEDESLVRYKQQLGLSANADSVAPFPDDKRVVIVKQLTLLVPDREDKVLDLTMPLEEIKNKKFVLKEGCKFKIKIDFYVQRDIVNGLKYVQKTYRLGARVDRMTHMIGSQAPKMEVQSSTTPEENAPSGLLARGSYTVTSLFTDDYNTEHLKWDWKLEVKSDWTD